MSDLRETLHETVLDLEGLAVELRDFDSDFTSEELAQWVLGYRDRLQQAIRDLDHSGSAISSHVHYTRLANETKHVGVAS